LEEKEKGRCFMKKLMLILVALVVAPAMAAVDFDVVDNGDCTVTISYTTTDGDLPRGLALNLLADGAIVESADSWATDEEFNVFLDYAFDNSEGYTVGMEGQTPIADPTAAGVGTLPASEISVCMGYLDENGIDPKGEAGPATCTNVITIAYSGTGTLTVSADTLRGPDSGVVGSELVSDLPITITLPGCGGDPCEDLMTGTMLTDYQAYQTNGKDPSSWCWQYQCHGDSDGANSGFPFFYQVYTGDLNLIVANWQAKIDTAEPSADVDHLSSGFPFFYRVYTGDLNTLVANWQKKAADLADCPTYLP
jgi:hypothetical protein